MKPPVAKDDRRFPKAVELRRALTPTTPWADRDRLPKDDRVNVRVSSTEKVEMTEAAESLGMDLSGYLIKLHRIATAMKGTGGRRRR